MQMDVFCRGNGLAPPVIDTAALESAMDILNIRS